MKSLFPFLIGKVLTLRSALFLAMYFAVVFPFLIGKVLTCMLFSVIVPTYKFPFLIGKVLTIDVKIKLRNLDDA